MKSLYLICLLLVGLSSCEDDIDIDFPEGGSNLVLNALIKNGDSIKASISESLPYQELELPSSLNNGLLSLYKDGVWVSNAQICKREVLINQFKDSTYTYCFNHLAEENSLYKIQASSPDYSIVAGETFSGTAAKFENLHFNGDRTFSFEINDNPEEENYYFFNISYKDTVNNSNALLLFLSIPDLTIEMVGGSDEVLSFPSSENVGLMGFVNDKSFNGKRKTINIQTISSTGFGYYDLKLTSCSKEYFQFSKTSLRAQYLFNNLFSSPTDVYSNVSNGYGIVASTWDTLVRFRD